MLRLPCAHCRGPKPADQAAAEAFLLWMGSACLVCVLAWLFTQSAKSYSNSNDQVWINLQWGRWGEAIDVVVPAVVEASAHAAPPRASSPRGTAQRSTQHRTPFHLQKEASSRYLHGLKDCVQQHGWWGERGKAALSRQTAAPAAVARRAETRARAASPGLGAGRRRQMSYSSSHGSRFVGSEST